MKRSDRRDEARRGLSLASRALLGCALSCGALVLPTVAHADEAPKKAGSSEARIDEARKRAATLYPTCTKKPSDADLKGAKGSHTAAKEFLERGLYDKAVESWHDAYVFDCSRPSVFYNLSNAYERSGDKPMTVAILEIATLRDPDADKSTLQAKIENLKAAIAAEPPDSGKVPAGSDAKADAKKGTKPLTPTEGRRPFGPAPWITLAVGGAALASGVPLLIVGRGKVSDAEKACPTHKGCDQKTQDLGNGGNTLTGVGIGLTAGGGALAIGSLIWQLAGNGVKQSSTVPTGTAVTVTPSVSPGLTGAFVTGRF